MRVTNERVKELMQNNTVTISSIADIRDLCHDILEARETIEKQEAIIKEMHKELEDARTVMEKYEAQLTGELFNNPSLNAILEKTKDYA